MGILVRGVGAPLAWVQGWWYGVGMITRRGLIGLVAAPAVVRIASLMPVRGVVMSVGGLGFDEEVVRAALDEIARPTYLPRLYMQLYRDNPVMGQIWEPIGLAVPEVAAWRSGG